jgi:hypothetical protein
MPGDKYGKYIILANNYNGEFLIESIHYRFYSMHRKINEDEKIDRTDMNLVKIIQNMLREERFKQLVRIVNIPKNITWGIEHINNREEIYFDKNNEENQYNIIRITYKDQLYFDDSTRLIAANYRYN